MEEERNELLEQETNQEVAEKTEENQTPTVEDNFGAGLLIGGGVVLLAGVAVNVVKKLRNKHRTEETDSGKVVKMHWYDKLKKHANPEETDKPIDVDASEVEESEDEEE